jgi:uncharacterized ion transporter superfamily protein YfcC
MRPIHRLLALVAAVCFFMINLGGAFWAMREQEIMHLTVHVTLAAAMGYLLPRIVRAMRRTGAAAR